MTEKTRAALEAAKKEILKFAEDPDGIIEPIGRALAKNLVRIIDDALSEPIEAESIPQLKGEITILQQRIVELEVAAKDARSDLASYTLFSQRQIRDAHEEGLNEGSQKQAQIIIHAEPYEIQTDVGVKYSAKGETQPEASVRITRHLEDGDEISDLLGADLSRGVEETMAAIEAQRKRNAEMR